MKYKGQITGLEVFSIVEVAFLGKVADLLINPDSGMIDFLVIEPEIKFLEYRLVAFNDVAGFGQDALTVETSAKVKNISSDPHALGLLYNGVNVVGAKVMTRSGRFSGVIDEILIDENSGKITECRWISDNKKSGFIPNNLIINFGKDLLIVDDEFESSISNTTPDQIAPLQVVTKLEKAYGSRFNPLEVKELVPFSKPKPYLVGRLVLTDILAEDGNIIAQSGDVVTQEMIERAVAADKYVDLTLNTRDK
ncbi:photosystem reaction center subunit H [Desulforamulus aquiferis]|uniref:Photosystem reaction center subunit H n=1 Tax=Desulforamulus aquiferis TaxID=1397668 RepID=A0AAW7ZFS9_9FIRM|nr:photosystem reaction center subunit H [Desulforamulus aquiferis]MDO7788573.1 photosystem reaction center subunit H [Desulforamulus aquiferis]